MRQSVLFLIEAWTYVCITLYYPVQVNGSIDRPIPHPRNPTERTKRWN